MSADPQRWRRRRAFLNHVELGGKYDSLLRGLLSATVNGLPPEFIDSDFARWGEISREVTWLLENLENSMSPTVLFDEEPLASEDTETRRWLMPLIHSLWLRRENVISKREETAGLLSTANAIFVRCRDCLLDSETPDCVRKQALRDLLNACRALCDSIHRLPSRVGSR